MIKSYLFYLFLILWTILFGLLLLPFLFLSKSNLYKPAYLWIDGIFFLLKTICGLTYEIKGKIEITNKKIKIIASKHQSAFETLLLFKFFPKAIFIHKFELFYIPIFGLYLKKIGMVSINRKLKSKALIKMMKESKEKILQGCSLIIFPEGTRKVIGSKPDYKPGIAALYKEINCDVLPVALNSGLFWSKNSYKIKPGKIIVEFLPIIKKGLDKKKFIIELEDSIEKGCLKLNY